MIIKNKSIYFLAGLLAFTSATFSSLANAAMSTIYNFGDLLTVSTGYTAPNNFASNPFANLVATNSGNGEYSC